MPVQNKYTTDEVKSAIDMANAQYYRDSSRGRQAERASDRRLLRRSRYGAAWKNIATAMCKIMKLSEDTLSQLFPPLGVPVGSTCDSQGGWR